MAVEMRADFRFHPAFQRELERELDPHMRRTAYEVWQRATGIAPRRTGYYMSRLEHRKGDYWGSYEVASMDPFGHLVEWGSVNNPAYAPLRKAVAAVGLRFEEEGR